MTEKTTQRTEPAPEPAAQATEGSQPTGFEESRENLDLFRDDISELWFSFETSWFQNRAWRRALGRLSDAGLETTKEELNHLAIFEEFNSARLTLLEGMEEAADALERGDEVRWLRIVSERQSDIDAELEKREALYSFFALRIAEDDARSRIVRSAATH